MKKFTESETAEIVRRLTGTCDSGTQIADENECDLEDIEEVMLDANMERCPGCGWWVECFELEHEGEAKSCDDCEPRPEEEE